MAINPERKIIFSRRCYVEGSLQPAAIIIAGEKILDVTTHTGDVFTDYGDDVIMPGVLDVHTHINEPGRTEWEGFDTGTKAAAAGGVTTLVDMPLNSSPVTTNLNALNQKLAASRDKLHVNVGFYGGLIPGNVHELTALADAGVLGVKCFLTHSGIDEFPNVNFEEISNALSLLKNHKIPLLAHCEWTANEPEKAKDFLTYNDYLNSRPDKWETDAIDGLIDCCRKQQAPIHIVHVSSALSISLIEAAKQAGLPVTAETCAHYIFFDAETIPNRQPVYKCAPPIRTKENNLRLKQALKKGILNFITSDHSPAPPEIKQLDSGNLATAWGGIAGLQFLLPASFTAMQAEMSLNEFIPLLTEKPAQFIGVEQKKGYLKPGFDADITVWKPEKVFEIKTEHIFHRHKPTPYLDKHLSGKVVSTYVNGALVFNNEKIISLNNGKWLLKK